MVRNLRSQAALLEDDTGDLKCQVVAKIMEGNRIINRVDGLAEPLSKPGNMGGKSSKNQFGRCEHFNYL